MQKTFKTPEKSKTSLRDIFKGVRKPDPVQLEIQSLQAAGFAVTGSLVSDNQAQAFLFDAPGNRFAVVKKERDTITTITADVGEVKSVDFRIEPESLDVRAPAGGGKYALGGAMIGGVGGLIVGSLLDGLRTPKLKRNVDFKLVAHLRLTDGNEIMMLVVDQSFGYGMTVDVFKADASEMTENMRGAVDTFTRWFGERIEAAHAAGREEASPPVPQHAVERVPCRKCGTPILPETSHRTGGLCMPCTRHRSKAH